MLIYEDISDIISKLAWNELVGQIEGDFIDCKRQIYDLSLDAQKVELAKDATSFANASGGFIIIGIETQKSQTHFSDEIVALNPFEVANIFDPNQHYSILNAWVYPKLENVRIEWRPEREGANRGFGIIVVPPQPDTKRPFLISKTILSSGKRVDILVGYAERKRDTSEPATLVELHAFLRDGMNFQRNISNQLAEIASRLPAGREAPHLPAEEITERVKKNLEATGLDKRKYFVLAAYPSEPTELPSLFNSSTNSITRILEQPPTIRDGAFALTTLDTAKIIDGDFRRVRNGSRKVVDLYPDGVLIFGCAADEAFLAWGIRDYEERPKLNTVALIEATYHFCLLYSEVLKRLSPKPKQIHFRFQLGNMHSSNGKPPVFIVPYGHNTAAQMFDDPAYPAPKDSAAKDIIISATDFDPGTVAYLILEQIYRWFGIESDFTIPYSEEIDGKRAISAARIQAI